jgi:tetratricopeptide (TPR) repeat protein
MLGYNSRETFQDATYDVQTQQLSSPERSIETHVYRNGKIISTVTTYYSEDAPIDSLEERMSQQHEETIGKVREGSYELVFLWISRGIIAFESQDYLQALECFESVLAIEETHTEANACLDKIQSCLKKDPQSRRRVLEGYQGQIDALEQSGRIMEASRKRAILARICKTPPPSDPMPSQRIEGGEQPLTQPSFRGDLLERAKETLPPRLREDLLARLWHALVLTTREDILPRIRDDLIPGIRGNLIPRMKEDWLPRLRENLFTKHLLVTFSTVVLVVLSGLIVADFQVKLDPVYHSSLGREYLKSNQLSPARNLFYGLLRQDPHSEEALAGFWEACNREGSFPRAGEMLAALVDSQDASPQVYFYLAEAYRLSSRCPEALLHYQEAAGKGYPELPCKLGMGLCLVYQKDVAAAIDLWEGLVQRGFDDYRIEYCLGTAYQASGRLGRASVHYSRALQERPQSGAIYRALGDCLYGLHQQEKAKRLWEKATSFESEDAVTARCAGHPEPDKDSGQISLSTLHACFPFPLI